MPGGAVRSLSMACRPDSHSVTEEEEGGGRSEPHTTKKSGKARRLARRARHARPAGSRGSKARSNANSRGLAPTLPSPPLLSHPCTETFSAAPPPPCAARGRRRPAARARRRATAPARRQPRRPRRRSAPLVEGKRRVGRAGRSQGATRGCGALRAPSAREKKTREKSGEGDVARCV